MVMRVNPAVDLSTIPARQSADWRRLPARAHDDWFLGLDIGQSIDPSAVCVLNRVVTPLDTWTPNGPGQYWKQDRVESFDVRHLERLPLQTPYPQQVKHVVNLLARPPLKSGCIFVLDYTGCGRPVADMFVKAGLRPKCVLITAGNETTQNGDAWHVPKQTLVSGLEARLHSGELRIAAALADAGALADELKDFSRKVSESGRVTFNARSGAHDDLVLAVAIALFAAINKPFVSIEELR